MSRLDPDIYADLPAEIDYSKRRDGEFTCLAHVMGTISSRSGRFPTVSAARRGLLPSCLLIGLLLAFWRGTHGIRGLGDVGSSFFYTAIQYLHAAVMDVDSSNAQAAPTGDLADHPPRGHSQRR